MYVRKGGAAVGNEEYLKYLMKQYGQLVYTICLRNCGNPFDAEDVMQETFLAAYKALDNFDRQKEQAWICRIALNKCLDFLKSAGRRQIPMEEVVSEHEAQNSVVPETIILEKESEQAIYTLCKSLKEPYGSIAVMRFCEGKSAKEISACTGEGLKTVQTHIYRAKEMLKNKLERSRGYSDG